MKSAIKDPETEAHAQAIAKAIFNEDTLGYVAAKTEAKMGDMKRCELLAFRDRVHYLVSQPERGEK